MAVRISNATQHFIYRETGNGSGLLATQEPVSGSFIRASFWQGTRLLSRDHARALHRRVAFRDRPDRACEEPARAEWRGARFGGVRQRPALRGIVLPERCHCPYIRYSNNWQEQRTSGTRG